MSTIALPIYPSPGRCSCPIRCPPNMACPAVMIDCNSPDADRSRMFCPFNLPFPQPSPQPSPQPTPSPQPKPDPDRPPIDKMYPEQSDQVRQLLMGLIQGRGLGIEPIPWGALGSTFIAPPPSPFQGLVPLVVGGGIMYLAFKMGWIKKEA